MKVRKYEPMDFAQISQWALEGYQATYEEHQFPRTGFIVDGLAAYFLYETDSSVCFLENLVANRFADQIARDQAISLVIARVLEEAELMGFKVAYATTNIPTVIFRALTKGAVAHRRQTLLVKKLNSGPT